MLKLLKRVLMGGISFGIFVANAKRSTAQPRTIIRVNQTSNDRENKVVYIISVVELYKLSD